jgi:hypothetical protein
MMRFRFARFNCQEVIRDSNVGGRERDVQENLAEGTDRRVGTVSIGAINFVLQRVVAIPAVGKQ